MFECDQFIYVRMQKTASRFILELLKQLFTGQTIGTHCCATTQQIERTPYFISSIRNPWDWYLSLWLFGVSGRGGLRQKLTKLQWRSSFKNPYTSLKDRAEWRRLYRSSNDIHAFRKWLALLCDPQNAHNLGEGYSPISHWVGFMTYRYLLLCCRFNAITKATLNDLNDFTALKKLEKQTCYIDYFIRQENLEQTFFQALEPVRSLSAEEVNLVKNAPRMNVSTRLFSLDDYYDQPSLDLIFNRDRLLVEKFNYLPPTLKA